MAVTGVNVTYGDYQFKPAPNVSYERETFSIKNNGKIIGGNYRVTLDGLVVTTGLLLMELFCLWDNIALRMYLRPRSSCILV
jgi:hypothetical protein